MTTDINQRLAEIKERAEIERSIMLEFADWIHVNRYGSTFEAQVEKQISAFVHRHKERSKDE